MKKLYLVLSMLKDWFTREIKYTIAVIATLILSCVVLFISWILLTEDFPSSKEYEQLKRTFGTDSYIDRFHLTEQSATALMSGVLPKIEYANVGGYARITAVNGRELAENIFESCDTILGEEQNAVKELVSSFYNPTYEISEGRFFTADELKEDRGVIILPDNLKINVGDMVTIADREYEVIGLNDDSYTRVLLPYSTMKIIQGTYIEPTLEDDYEFLTGGPMALQIAHGIRFEKKLSTEQKAFLADIYGRGITGENIESEFLPTMKNDAIFIIISIIASIILALFCALCVYSLFVYLCKSSESSLNIFKVCGANYGTIYFLLLFQIFFCMALSYAVSCIAMIPIQQLLKFFNKRGEIRPIDYVVVAAIYLSVIVGAVLPTIKTLAKRTPSAKGGGLQ